MPLASTTSPPRKSRSSVVTTPGTRRKESWMRRGLGWLALCDKLFLTFCFRKCRLLISTKCAGMGCDVPDITLTVCIGEMGGIYKDINKFK